MNTPQSKKLPKRAMGVAGSLAYYNLLAGMTFTPGPMTLSPQKSTPSAGSAFPVAEDRTLTKD